MQRTQFLREWVRILVLGVAACLAGCGPGGRQDPTAGDKEAGKLIAEGNRKFHQQVKEASAKAKKNTPSHKAGRSRVQP